MGRVVKLFTNGKRADDQYGLASRVGRIVKRADDAKKLAVASTARKSDPIAKTLITSVYGIRPSYLENSTRSFLTNDKLEVDASAKRFPLSLFRGFWGGRKSAGAKASLLLGQSKTYTGAFIAPGRYKGTVIPLIYTRIAGKKKLMQYGRYKGKTREVIVANRGPSAYDMLMGNDPERVPAGVPNLSQRLYEQLKAFYISELTRQYARSDT